MLSKQSGGMEYLLSCPIWVESRFAAWISAINELFFPSYLPFFRVACLHVIYIKPDLPNFPVRAKSNNAGFLELCNISFLEGKKIKFSCVCPIPMCPQNLSLLLCFTIFKYLFLNERILSLSFFFLIHFLIFQIVQSRKVSKLWKSFPSVKISWTRKGLGMIPTQKKKNC